MKLASVVGLSVCAACGPSGPSSTTAQPTTSVELRTPPNASKGEPPQQPPTDASALAAASSHPCAKPSPSAPTGDEQGTWPCYESSDSFGCWRPSPDEVLTVLRAFPADCGVPTWQAAAVRACMRKLGASDVIVMQGYIDGPHSTARDACQLGIRSGEWNGRRFIVIKNWFRDDHTFYGYKRVYEVTTGAPVLFMDGATTYMPLCQGGDASSPAPPGWDTFPAELRELFC